MIENIVFVLDAQSESDFVIEYVGLQGPERIIDDITLQKAYIVNTHSKLIIGVKLREDYIPYSTTLAKELVV